jgi:hypothetical protein
VGSTPIGSTNLFKGLDNVPPLETLPELPIVRMFLLSDGHRGDRRLSARYQREFSQLLDQKRLIGTGHHGLGLDSLQYSRITVVVGW